MEDPPVRSLVLLGVAFLAVGLTATAPPLAAHPYYKSDGRGIATSHDGVLYEISVIRRPTVDNLLNHEPGLDPLAIFDVKLFEPGNPVEIEAVMFFGEDTYYDHLDDAFLADPVNGPPPAIPYHGLDTDPTVSFELTGVQVGKTVSGVGTYNDVTFYIVVPV